MLSSQNLGAVKVRRRRIKRRGKDKESSPSYSQITCKFPLEWW